MPAISTLFWQPLYTKAWASRLQRSHLHTRNPMCPRMLAISFCVDSDLANSCDNRIRGLAHLYVPRKGGPAAVASRAGKVKIPTITSQNKSEDGIGLLRR